MKYIFAKSLYTRKIGSALNLIGPSRMLRISSLILSISLLPVHKIVLSVLIQWVKLITEVFFLEILN
jgi:hypothetical protein